MPIIEYDVYKQKLGALGPRLEKLAAALDLEGARREVEELEEKTNDANFWNDIQASQKVLQRTKHLKNKLESHARLVSQWEDLTTLVEMAMEEDDASLLPEVEESYGPGLVPDALPDVHPLGGAAQLYGQDPGL